MEEISFFKPKTFFFAIFILSLGGFKHLIQA